MEVLKGSTARSTGNFGHALHVQQRERDARREELEKEAKLIRTRETMLNRVAEMDERVEEKRALRHQAELRFEREMQEAILKGEQQRLIKERQIEQEQMLAKELQRQKIESTRDAKMRQQIRESSAEIRELEQKLRAGYLNKERAAQIAEKEAQRYEKDASEAEMIRVMKADSKRALEEERRKEEERAMLHREYQKGLEKQLEEQERRRQKAYEEFLKEKLMIDEIVRKIYEEDQRVQEMALQKKEATKRYIDEFMRTREEWKQKEEEKLAEENRKIIEYAKLQEQREAALAEERKQRDITAERVHKALSEEIAARDRQREEMEQIRQELYLEAEEAKAREKTREDFERRIKQRLELQADYEKQLEMRRMRRDAEAKAEEEFRQQMLAKFAEDDRIEQMNAQKRRMKQQEHKRAVEELLLERRKQFELAQEELLAERKMAEQFETYRRQIVEEERQRLLKDHAERLIGYLPKGVIKSESDLDVLGPRFRDEYRPPADTLDEEEDDEYYIRNYRPPRYGARK